MGKAEALLKTQKIGIKWEMINRARQDASGTGLFRSVSDGSGPSSRTRAGRPDRKNRPDHGRWAVNQNVSYNFKVDVFKDQGGALA